MTTSWPEFVRRGLRDLLAEPPWRRVGYVRNTGPRLERDLGDEDGAETGVVHAAVEVRGRDAAVTCGLSWVDPLAMAAQHAVPEDVWCPTVIDARGVRQRWVRPTWRRSLHTGGRRGTVARIQPLVRARQPFGVESTRPIHADGPVEAAEAHLRVVLAADAVRSRLDQIRVPSLDELYLEHGRDPRSAAVDPFALALSLAVRGRRAEARNTAEAEVAYWERQVAQDRDPLSALVTRAWLPTRYRFAEWLAGSALAT